MNNSPSPMEAVRTPLVSGMNLIEASAGTGKTFTIAWLFLRLIAEKGLLLPEILVVTYTEAATAELRERLRRLMHEVLQAMEGPPPSDSPIADWLVGLGLETENIRARLRAALKQFDQASISTIHGLCRHALQDSAFETGLCFDTQLQTDDQRPVQEVVADYCRRQWNELTPLLASLLLEEGVEPARLQALLSQALRNPTARLLDPGAGESIEEIAAKLHQDFESIRQLWKSNRTELVRGFGEKESWGKAPYDKRDKLDLAAGGLDLLTDSESPSARALEAMQYFCAGAIQAKVRKKSSPPNHPFYNHCQRFCEQSRLFVLRWQFQFLEQSREVFRRKLQEEKCQTFDLLLTQLKRALEDSPELEAKLRKKFPAILIDEFQDTDPVQYAIFRRIAGEETCLYLIGDPKQAIFSFRGADIFTYLNAKRDCSRHFTLLENYRSEEPLVQAVNQFFSGHGNPFVIPEIAFHPVGAATRRTAILAGDDRPRLEVWYFPDSQKKDAAREEIARLTASEIARLLQPGAAENIRDSSGERPLRPSDLAVLVRNHREAAAVQKELRGLMVPSVLYTEESVFKTDEAAEFRQLLAAIAQPTNESLIRAALSTAFFEPGSAPPGLVDSEAWNETAVRFHQFHQSWVQEGFYRMFRRLSAAEKLRQRLLAYPDGERRLTNVLHLAEILHQAAIDHSFSPRSLVHWLGQRRAEEAKAEDVHQLRLESDDNAVRIVTIHKAKGLEYGLVFCPYAWSESPRNKSASTGSLFHKPDTHELVWNLDKPSEEEKNLLLAEQLAESVRLFYVASTRARHRLTVAMGDFPYVNRSALHWLLLANPPVKVTSEELKEPIDYEARLRSMSAKSDRIQVTVEPERTAMAAPLPQAAAPSRLACEFRGEVLQRWGVESFTGLIARATFEETGEVVDLEPAPVPVDQTDARRALSQMPRGTRLGICLHQIFQHLNFQDPEHLGELAWKNLSRHGYADPELKETICGMISTALEIPIGPQSAPFILRDVPKHRRSSEVEFYFRLKPFKSGSLERILQRNGLIEKNESVPTFESIGGFMKGSMDLVCEQDGCYYLVDWKSNWLGEGSESYRPEALKGVMRESSYMIQLLIYSIALDAWLRQRVAGYELSRHFGGVYYLFLRGLDLRASGQGVFGFCPSLALVDDLRELWIETLDLPSEEGNR